MAGKVKFVMALRTYFQAEPHGRPTTLTDLKDFLKALMKDERTAAKVELEGYGYEIEEGEV